MSQFSFDDLLAYERRIHFWGISCAVVAWLLTGFLWWHTLSVNPQRVFWGTIENNFSTRGVTMESTQRSGSANNSQNIQFQFGADPKALSLTTLTQGKALVKTESLSTPLADYTRYIQIVSDKKGKDGKPLDTTKVLGAWAIASTTNKDRNVPQLFGQVLPSLSIPFGNVPASQRRTLMQELRDLDLYDTPFQDVKKQRQNGRLQYVYTVQMQPILYLRFMKDFAKATGLHELDKIDPNSYSGAKAINVKWTIDAHAHQLVAVDYGNGHKETYHGYGLPVPATPPAHPISSAELQRRLTQMQE